MDVGLGLWLVLLIVFAVRSPAHLSAGRTYLLLVIGAVVNLAVVITVGFIQGGWAPLLVLFAIEAGIACLHRRRDRGAAGASVRQAPARFRRRPT